MLRLTLMSLKLNEEPWMAPTLFGDYVLKMVRLTTLTTLTSSHKAKKYELSEYLEGL